MPTPRLYKWLHEFHLRKSTLLICYMVTIHINDAPYLRPKAKCHATLSGHCSNGTFTVCRSGSIFISVLSGLTRHQSRFWARCDNFSYAHDGADRAIFRAIFPVAGVVMQQRRGADAVSGRVVSRPADLPVARGHLLAAAQH